MADKRLKSLIWLTAGNGWSLLVVAGMASLVFLAVSFSWSGLLVGLALCAAASMELKGNQLLRSGQPVRGLTWAGWSQLAVFGCIVVYSLIQLSSLDSASLLALLSQDNKRLLMELYGVDESILGELLLIATRITYLGLIIATFLYQGGLWVFYGIRRRQFQTHLPEGEPAVHEP